MITTKFRSHKAACYFRAIIYFNGSPTLKAIMIYLVNISLIGKVLREHRLPPSTSFSPLFILLRVPGISLVIQLKLRYIIQTVLVQRVLYILPRNVLINCQLVYNDKRFLKKICIQVVILIA